MADQQPRESSSTSDVSSGSSESTVELNIKTLDSRIFRFHVEKNIVILAFKEIIAIQSGVPVGQQRLIFRGKVLKDDHLLSEYNVENGDTLHLVERQAQPSSGSGGGGATSSGSRGQDSTVGGSRSRIGQISHSVVLGSLNVGDSGESIVPDLGRVIGAVLNSIGIGNLGGGMQPGVQETEGSLVNSGSQSQGGNVPWQSLHGQPNAVQIPMGAAIAVPSLNMPIHDSLNTLVEFISRMELAISQNGDQHNQSPVATLPTVELPSNSRGVPTVEALTIVLRHSQRLLGSHAVSALSHTADRLEQEGASTDPTMRGQIQTESMQLGVTMQHLGALLLELGRTILTLRMGQTPADSFVNAGPAVYISPSGPNPIMVQPFPLQTSSLFGGSGNVVSNPVATGPVGLGSAPRNVNIHIHTVTSRVNNGEGTQGERASGADSGDSSQARLLSGLNVTATAVPSVAPVVSISGAIQPGTGVLQSPESSSIPSVVAEINDQIRSLVANAQNENHAPSEGLTGQGQPFGSGARDDDGSSQLMNLASSIVGETSQTLPHGMNDQKSTSKMGDVVNSNNELSTSVEIGSHNPSSASEHVENLDGPTRSIESSDNPDVSSGVPIGLGLGGLQPKRRERKRGQGKNSDVATASSHNQQSRAVGQQVLQSLASSTRRNVNTLSSRQSRNLAGGVIGSVPTGRENADGQIDIADAMSQVLQSPALDSMLAGVSQQVGVGSPDIMRNMLQQFTQNPAMRNTMSQIAQQVDSHDLGSMFSGFARGQGGGIDLAGMVQQMMPIVSQALGGVSSAPQSNSSTEPFLSDSSTRRDLTPNSNDPQINLRQVVQRLENPSSSEEIFCALAENAVQLSGDTNALESIMNDLCSHGGLAEELVETLRHDVSRRFEDDMGS